MSRIFRLLLIACVLGLVPVEAGWACPGCSQVSEAVGRAEPETVKAGLALSWSVLFLLGVVGGVFSFLGVYIARTVARLERDSEV